MVLFEELRRDLAIRGEIYVVLNIPFISRKHYLASSHIPPHEHVPKWVHLREKFRLKAPACPTGGRRILMHLYRGGYYHTGQYVFLNAEHGDKRKCGRMRRASSPVVL